MKRNVKSKTKHHKKSNKLNRKTKKQMKGGQRKRAKFLNFFHTKRNVVKSSNNNSSNIRMSEVKSFNTEPVSGLKRQGAVKMSKEALDANKEWIRQKYYGKTTQRAQQAKQTQQAQQAQQA